MGVELLAIGAGTAAKAYMGQNSAHAMEGAERRAIAQQAIDRAKAENLVGANTAALKASNPEADRARLAGDFVNQLRANAGRINAATPAVAGANPRYAEAVSSGNAAADEHTNKIANFISAIRAAQLQREAESQRANHTATLLSGVQQDAGQDAANSQLDLNRAATPNPWLEYGTQLLGNLASSNILMPKPTMPIVPPAGGGTSPWGTPSGGSSPTGNSSWATDFFKK